jgi:hypothetical protein
MAESGHAFRRAAPKKLTAVGCVPRQDHPYANLDDQNRRNFRVVAVILQLCNALLSLFAI